MANTNGAGVQQLSDGSDNGCQIQEKFLMDDPSGSHSGHIDAATAILSPIDATGLNSVMLQPASASTDYFAFSNLVSGQVIHVMNIDSSDGALVVAGGLAVGTVAVNAVEILRVATVNGVLTGFLTGQ